MTGIGHETATLNAEVNPDELATTYHFEYGETTEYGTEIPAGGASIGTGATPVPVTAPPHGPEARRDLPLPRRRHQQRGHHHRTRPDLHDRPAGADHELRPQA